MRIDLKNIASVLIDKYLIILFLIFALTVLSGLGLSNFKLDASSDALVLENDESLKTYREAEDEFGDSSFLIVTYEPSKELFSDYSINRIANLENDLKNIDGVDSVLSLLDAPIFFQPKVGLTDVADNLKDITFEDIDLDPAKEEIINNPIYKELIISKDGKVTAMQVVLKGNNEYNNLITKRYAILEKLDSKEVLTSKSRLDLQNDLNDINSRISKINDSESEFNKILINNIRNTLDKYRDDATIYLGGPSMIATDMMEYIESDLTIFGLAVAIIFAVMLYLFFGSIWLVILPLMNAFLATFIKKILFALLECIVPSPFIIIQSARSSFSLFTIVSALVMSLITLPIIKGTTIRKENLAAFSLSIPRITAVEIVAPDLEIPGIIAIACAIPTTREDEKLIFFSLGLAFLSR